MLSLYLERQKKHWQHVLCEEMRDELSKSFKDGLREGENNIKMLEDKLNYFHQLVQSLEVENNKLSRRITELSHADNDLWGRSFVTEGTHKGEPRADRRPEKRRRESPPASLRRACRQPSPQLMRLSLPRKQQSSHQLPPLPRARKQKCDLYKMDDDDTMDEPTLLNSKEEREMVSFALEASRRTQCKDRDRMERQGESSMVPITYTLLHMCAANLAAPEKII